MLGRGGQCPKRLESYLTRSIRECEKNRVKKLSIRRTSGFLVVASGDDKGPLRSSLSQSQKGSMSSRPIPLPMALSNRPSGEVGSQGSRTVSHTRCGIDRKKGARRGFFPPSCRAILALQGFG